MGETIEVVVFNAVGVETGEHNGEKVMKQAARFGQVLLGCESDHINVRNRTEPVDPALFKTFHKMGDESKDGALMSVRKDAGIVIGDPFWREMSHGQSGKMNSRYLLGCSLILPNGSHVSWGAFHAAPGRYPLLRSEGLRSVKHAPVDLFGGDLNVRARAVSQRFQGRQVRSEELLHVVAKRNKGYHLKPNPKRIHLIGSDHPGLLVTVVLD